MSKALVVDGTNILMRSIKAAERDVQLSVEIDGEPVNTAGVFLFIRVLTKYVRQEAPDSIVVCWDGGRSRMRMEIYPEYKSARLDRIDPDRDIRPFDLAKEFLTLSGINHIEIIGVEADDLVAAYTRAERSANEVLILSGDKDFLQLVGTRVSQIRPGVKPEKWGPDEVEAKFGVTPRHMPYLMALTGDASDGVPGIRGFGAKTAAKFLAKYDYSLHKLLNAKEPRLVGQEEDVYRNLALVDLRQPQVWLDHQIGPMREFVDPVTSMLYPELVEWLKTYQMDSVLRDLQAGTLWKHPVQGTLV